MGSLADLQGTTVAIDTAPLIYYIEQTQYVDLLDRLFDEVDRGGIRIVASVMTLLEVLVMPLKQGDIGLAARYNDILLSSPNVHVVSITAPIAQLAAEIRADTGIKTPDAIQAATALYHRATLLTNDRDLSRVDQLSIARLRELTL